MKHIGIIIVALTTLLAIGVVSAAPVFDGQRSGIGANDTKDFAADDSYTATGGNITNFDLSVESQTYHWVGFWGNVTYSLVLEGAGNAGFYDWGTQNPQSGTVLFSPSTNVDWASITVGSATELALEDVALSLTTATDNLSNTFTDTNAGSLVLGTETIAVHTSPSLNTSSNGGADWETIFLYDGVTYVYATPIDPGNQNYGGTAADFQTMVPVDAGAAYQRTYYVYVSLDPTA